MIRFEVIDYLKGYSIITVVLMHLFQDYLSMPNIINKALSLGGAGVHVFIFCSGFGLFYSSLNKPLSYKSFLKKRFIKIYIPYIVIIIISSLIPFMYNYSHKFVAVLSHVFLFKMFSNKYECSFGGQFWFLSTIIQFYLIFNLLIYCKNRLNSNKKFITLSLGLSVCWWMITGILGKTEIRVWGSFFIQYLWEFSLGMVLADIIYRNNGKFTLPKKSILLFISILLLSLYGFVAIKGGVLKLFDDIPSLLGYGGLALFVYSLNIKVINKTIIKLSSFSYELYLVHILIFSCIFKLFNNIKSQILIAIISIVVSIVVSKLYNIFLRKLLNFKLG
jgi:peptidoglycan/LPS O-acetylase OafA/YrhL